MAFICLAYTSTLSLAFSAQTQLLSKAIRLLYQQGGTLAVLKRSEGMSDFSASQLVHSAVEASDGKKGVASGILAAFLGACCQHGGDSSRALDLLQAYDDLPKLKPDLLALCLAYTAISKDKMYQTEADAILNRAANFYPNVKTGGVPSTKETQWAVLEKSYGIKLLQDTKDFVVVSKPSGMVCYHGSTAKQRKSDMSLEQCLELHGVELSSLNDEGKGMVHRIDRGTSGCLVLAKTNRMHALLVAQFFTRSIQKCYQALVYKANGDMRPASGSINMDIDGRPALSKYHVQAKMGNVVFRVKVQTEQGRRHQVRKHCAEGLGAPILLDPLYGGEAVMAKLKIPVLPQHRAKQRFCLHASTLQIPQFGIDAKAPIPGWWLELEDTIVEIDG